MDEDTHLHDKGDADGVGPEKPFVRESAASRVPFCIHSGFDDLCPAEGQAWRPFPSWVGPSPCLESVGREG